MATSMIIGTIITSKIAQIVFASSVASKFQKRRKGRKVVDQHWKLTQFLEESKQKKLLLMD